MIILELVFELRSAGEVTIGQGVCVDTGIDSAANISYSMR